MRDFINKKDIYRKIIIERAVTFFSRCEERKIKRWRPKSRIATTSLNPERKILRFFLGCDNYNIFGKESQWLLLNTVENETFSVFFGFFVFYEYTKIRRGSLGIEKMRACVMRICIYLIFSAFSSCQDLGKIQVLIRKSVQNPI